MSDWENIIIDNVNFQKKSIYDSLGKLAYSMILITRSKNDFNSLINGGIVQCPKTNEYLTYDDEVKLSTYTDSAIKKAEHPKVMITKSKTKLVTKDGKSKKTIEKNEVEDNKKKYATISYEFKLSIAFILKKYIYEIYNQYIDNDSKFLPTGSICSEYRSMGPINDIPSISPFIACVFQEFECDEDILKEEYNKLTHTLYNSSAKPLFIAEDFKTTESDALKHMINIWMGFYKTLTYIISEDLYEGSKKITHKQTIKALRMLSFVSDQKISGEFIALLENFVDVHRNIKVTKTQSKQSSTKYMSEGEIDNTIKEDVTTIIDNILVDNAEYTL